MKEKMSKQTKEAVFITQWKEEMMKRLQMRFKDRPLSKKKLNTYLDSVIRDHMVNPEVDVVNNYREAVVHTDLLSLIDTIHENQLIIGGGGVLFVQHDTEGRDNIMFDYIASLKKTRNFHKNERKKYEKNTDPWIREDIAQANVKIKVNSLYGVHGYNGFVVYNRFIAEAITNCGRQIITTAALTFENFLSGSVKLNTEDEIYKFITNVTGEYDENIKYEVFLPEDLDHKVMKKLIDMCAFDPSDQFVRTLQYIVEGLSVGEKILLYYKNNLYAFTDHPIIREKLRAVLNEIEDFKKPDRGLLEKEYPGALELVDEIWGFYKIFVVYDYASFDRVRKAMYTDRHNVLYVDTDSNFLGLNEWVEYTKHEVMEDQIHQDMKEFEFIVVNLMALFLSNVIDLGLKTLARNMNVTDEYAKIFNMKNEFYLDRIVFTDAKKRYISNSVLQEGDLLNKGKGLPDIKGFDFKKAGTKEYIRDYYTKLCEEKILRANPINVEEIYRDVLDLKSQIDDSVLKGESRFFKQSTVQIIEHYKNPYSTQGVVAVMLWNTLNPQFAMELPTDCDIVPIHELTGPKRSSTGKITWPNEEFVMEFRERFPDAYERLNQEIYENPNELIRNMGLTSIAKPKNAEIELPPWFSFLLDNEKVSRDALNLISPILHSLGLNGLKTNASTEYMSNIIDL